MEREIIHYLLWNLTISGTDRQTIASVMKPRQCPCRYIPRQLLSTPISTSNDPPPSYTTYPQDDRGKVVSPIQTLHLIPLTIVTTITWSQDAIRRRLQYAVDTGKQASPHQLYQPPFERQNEARTPIVCLVVSVTSYGNPPESTRIHPFYIRIHCLSTEIHPNPLECTPSISESNVLKQ